MLGTFEHNLISVLRNNPSFNNNAPIYFNYPTNNTLIYVYYPNNNTLIYVYYPNNNTH